MVTKVGSSILIRAPVDKVFRRIARHDRCNDWLEFISKAVYTSEQRTGAGTSAHQWGQIAGRRMEWDGRIVEWVENNRIVWQASSGMPERMQMEALNWVRNEDEGTRYGLEIKYKPPYSIIGKIMDVITIRRTIAKSIQDSLENLKKVVEQE